MSNSIIPTLYRDIINKVIEDARVDFEAYNIDESILDELRITWEKKLYDTNVADFSVLEDDEYYGEPIAVPTSTEPTTATVPHSTAVSSTSAPLASSNPSSAAPSPSVGINRPVMGSFTPSARPSPSSTPILPPSNIDEQVPQYDGSDRYYVADMSSCMPTTKQLVNLIKQVDGTMSDDDDDDPDAINSDLDDEDEDEDDETDAEAQNQVLCLYEKVNRTKNKWKCVMREGIIHIHGKDYAFGKLTGEYQF